MSLLKNHICELEILNRKQLIFNDDSTPKSVNIVSSVFFKREEYYKNFGIYVKGLARTIRFIDDYNLEVEQANKKSISKTEGMEKFVFVLFIDSNVRDDKKLWMIIERSHNVVPVLFTCSDYMKGKYHLDLFGTLLRFFPMFNFEGNPAKTVLCIDIDLNNEDKRKVKALMTHRPEGVTASGEIQKLIYKGEVPYIYAGTLMYNRDKIDSKIILDFIESAHTIKSTGHYGTRKTTFGYGIDEIFLNSYLLPAVKYYSIIIEYQISYFLYFSEPYIKKQKRSDMTKEVLKLILYDMYNPNLTIDDMLGFIDDSLFVQDLKKEIKRQSRQISEIGVEDSKVSGDTPLLDTKRGIISDTEKQGSFISKILQKLLGDLYDPSKSVEELLRIIDNKTYNVREKNEVNNALAERFYYIIHDLLKNDKTWMEKDIMELIDKHLRNIISSIVLFKIDPDNKEIVDITTYDTVYTDTII